MRYCIGMFGIIFGFLLNCPPSQSFGCTDFLLKASDGSVVAARSMEFAQPLRSRIIFYPNSEKEYRSTAPGGRDGLKWRPRFSYIAVNALDLDIPVDGFNEKGLSFGLLWLSGTEYEKISSTDSERALAITDLGKWILSCFSTVREVQEALDNVCIWGDSVQSLAEGIVPPLHVSVHDAEGQSLVVEFINGEKKVYRNSIQVLTNAPTFDWQMTNITNYLNLRAMNAGPVKIGGDLLEPPGNGSGLQGIPGDWSPPSRFVKIAAFKQFANTPENALSAVNLALHLLNTVDIPFGGVVSSDKGIKVEDYTQWIVVKNLTDRILFFRSYQDQNIYKVDFESLAKISAGSKSVIDIPTTSAFIDATDSFAEYKEEKRGESAS